MKARASLAILALLLLVSAASAQTLVPENQITSVEERRILVSLEQEYAKLEQREVELDGRELQLKTLQSEVDKKLAAMESLRDELDKLLNRKEEEEGRRAGELSKIYEKMDPNKAAQLIKELDTQVAIEILIGIKKKTAGQILDRLDTATATKLSKAFTEMPVKDSSGY